MSTNTGYNDNNNNNNNNYNDKPAGGNSMLNSRKLRLSVYMIILLVAAVPNCIIFGNAIDNDQCPTDDEDSRDCNAGAAGWYLLMLGIVIVGFFLWVLPNSESIVDNNIAKVIFAFIIAIAAIMLIVAVFLSYDEIGCFDDPTSDGELFCLSYFGYEWFVFCHAFLLAIDIGSDFGSDINKRILTYSISYIIGCCILFSPTFENDFPSETEEVHRAGVMMIFLGSLIAAIICIVNISRKSSIGTGSGEWATRILSLVWILGGILFISGFTLYTFYLALLGALGGVSYYSTWGYGWVILLGVLVHGFDVAHL